MKQVLLVYALALCMPSTVVGENRRSEGTTSRNQEWQELTGQIGKGVTGGRFKTEALDPQALILAGDRDPLDVVLRRTNSLIQHFKRDGKLSAATVGSFEK